MTLESFEARVVDSWVALSCLRAGSAKRIYIKQLANGQYTVAGAKKFQAPGRGVHEVGCYDGRVTLKDFHDDCLCVLDSIKHIRRRK